MVQYLLGPVHGVDGADGDAASDYSGYAGTDGAPQSLSLTGTISQPGDPVLRYDLTGGRGGHGGDATAIAAGTPGVGATGGNGGDATVGISSASFDPELAFSVYALGGAGGHGGSGSENGGYWVINQTTGESTFIPNNGPGGDAGLAGNASIDVTDSLMPWSTTLYAQAGYGGSGGAGGRVPFGFAPDGLSSDGGDAQVSVTGSTFAGIAGTPPAIWITAIGGNGQMNFSRTGSHTHASDGGDAAVVFYGNTLTSQSGTSLTIALTAQAREAGGTYFNDGRPMGIDGDGSILFTNNQMLLGADNNSVSFTFAASGGGRFGAATVAITGNMLDGGDGYDTLIIDSYTMTNVYAGGIYSGITFDMMLNDVRSFEEIRTSWQFATTILGDNNDNRLVAGWSNTTSDAAQTIDGRGGNDVLVSGQGNDLLDGGADQDTAVFTGNRNDYTITVLANGSLSVSDNRSGSIFIDGTDTVTDVELLQFADGTISTSSFYTGVTITGTSRADIITPLQTVAGQPAVTALNDTIFALGGSDRIDGGAGADLMYGGSGNDTYYVDNAGDRAIEDRVAGVDDRGTDLVYSSVSFALGAFVENLTLTGSGDIDATGNGLANRLVGNAGDNRLNGGVGADMLTGGLGADTFVLDVAGTNRQRDTFVDFVAGTDRIEISTSAFPALAAYGLGALDPSELAYGRRATTADQHLIYNSATGELIYDPDGAGGAAGITLAVLTGLPSLGSGDIFLAP